MKPSKNISGRTFLIRNLLLTGLVLASASALRAAPLAEYDFYGYNGNAADADTATPTTPGNLVTASTLSFGSGLSDANYLSNTFAYANADQTSLAAAISSNDYVSFTVTPTSGQVNLTDIAIEEFDRGTSSMELALTDASGNLYSEVSAAATDQSAPLPVDLLFGATGATISSATQFRIYAFDGPSNYVEAGFSSELTTDNITADNGSGFTIDGDTLTTPEPSTYALVGIGLSLLLFVTYRHRASQ
jgi:hypothetical protein